MSRFMTWPGLLVPLFGGGCVLSLIAIGWETGWGAELRPKIQIDSTRTGKLASTELLPSFALAPLDAGFPQSLERPLFLPTRRPIPTATPTPKLRPGQFVLVGTSRTKEFGDSAILKELSSNKSVVVKLGGVINDMTLESVEATRVTLKLGEEQETLEMRARPQPAGARPGAPAAQPAAPAPGNPAQRQAQAAMNSGIFGGSPSAAAIPPGAVFVPGGPPGSPTVFPGSPGANYVVPNAAQGSTGANNQPNTQPRAPTPEEILERRRRARAQQTQ